MDKMYEINVKSSYMLIREALPHMKNRFIINLDLTLLIVNYYRDGANICIISSYAGYQLDNIPIGFYSITKTTLVIIISKLKNKNH